MALKDYETSLWQNDAESAGVIILVLSYLMFVLRIGPTFMKNRQPYKLTNTLLVYNAVQVVVSAYLAVISLNEILETGLLPRKCHISNEDHWKMVYIGNRLYFFAKISELLDTVFFVLRKKNNQVSFLHVYHHTGMVVCHILFKYHPSHVTSMIRFINSSVHVVMYAYYGLAALGPNVAKYLTWKKYITTMQLVQFVFLFFYTIAMEQVTECPSTQAHAIFLAINITFVTLLFGNFYRQSYMRKEKNKVNAGSRSDTEIVQKENIKID